MSDAVRLETYQDSYLEECEYLKCCTWNTLRLYRQAFRVWPTFGHGIHPNGAIKAMVEGRKRGLSPTTVNNYLRVMKAFWNWLAQRGHLEAVPKIKRLPEPKRVKPVFGSEQVVAILRAKPRQQAVKRVQALFAVAVDTGLRFGELVSIRRQDVDGKSMLLTVDGKTGERRVPISAEGLRWIMRHLQTHAHSRLFATNTGTVWDYAHARRELKTLFELAGVPVELAQFHHIRRYALRQYVGVAGLRGAQLLAGHSKPETTLRYLDADAELRALPHGSISPLARLSGYKR